MPVTTHSTITDNDNVTGTGRVVLTINHKTVKDIRQDNLSEVFNYG